MLINLAIYRSVDDKSPVLQLNRDVPAGQQISADDFRTVEIGADGAFRSVPSSDLNAVVGSYAQGAPDRWNAAGPRGATGRTAGRA
ncbi:MAG: SAF domain-containing protein, partial [Ilumatobacteraceae bacterium]